MTRNKLRPPANQAAIDALLSSGYVPIHNHPDYLINPHGVVYRITVPKLGPVLSYPRLVNVVDFSNRVASRCPGYKLAAPPPYKRIRCVTIRTLLRENFGKET